MKKPFAKVIIKSQNNNVRARKKNEKITFYVYFYTKNNYKIYGPTGGTVLIVEEF